MGGGKMAKDIQVDPRIIVQLANVTVKNLVDGIVELLTNSDDSYRRAEHKDIEIPGEMEIYVSRKKRGACERLVVKDFAEGMNNLELEKSLVFAAETSGLAEGKSVRGLFGRGLKETMLALGEGEIKTIKDGKISRTRLWLAKKPQYDDVLLRVTQDTEEHNGTEIDIKVTNEKIKIPGYEKFVEQLSNHYALRDINSSSARKITLTFEDSTRKSKKTTIINFLKPEGKKVVEKEIVLPNLDERIKITVYETPTSLESPKNNPFGLAGILIKTNSAILDNQLFSFDNDPAALYFYGEALCEGLEARLRKGEMDIINPNRGGLEWRHDYSKELQWEIERILEPLIYEKKKTLETKPEREVTEPTKEMLKDLCNLLSDLAKEELEEIQEGPAEPEPNIKSLTVKPEVANLIPDKPRTLSIYAPAEIVQNEGQEAHIKSDNVDIHTLSSSVKLQEHPKYPGEIWYRYFNIVGNRDGAQGNVTVKLGNETAIAKVKVAPPQERKKGRPRGSKGGFISDIKPDDLVSPSQRVVYVDGVIKVFTRFPSVARFIKSGLEGVETAEGRLLLAELVGEAFCKEVARQGMDLGKYPKPPGGEIDSFNAVMNELQKKYLHKIQEIIFARELTSLTSTVESPAQLGLIKEGKTTSKYAGTSTYKTTSSSEEKDGSNKPGSSKIAESVIYTNYDADYFFSLAHWAKDTERLAPWERKFVFNIGKYLYNKWQISEKQEKLALKIIQRALEAGFTKSVAAQITAMRKKEKHSK